MTRLKVLSKNQNHRTAIQTICPEIMSHINKMVVVQVRILVYGHHQELLTQTQVPLDGAISKKCATKRRKIGPIDHSIIKTNTTNTINNSNRKNIIAHSIRQSPQEQHGRQGHHGRGKMEIMDHHRPMDFINQDPKPQQITGFEIDLIILIENNAHAFSPTHCALDNHVMFLTILQLRKR